MQQRQETADRHRAESQMRGKVGRPLDSRKVTGISVTVYSLQEFGEQAGTTDMPVGNDS